MGTSFPGDTNIWANIPSSCASKSTDALSVSIVQSESPARKESPTWIVQAAILPVSMVGDKAGMGNIVWGGYSVVARYGVAVRLYDR